MTCEAVCMNRLGLAIAVDSAVSIGPKGRAYPSADKLFPLDNGAPVAIAIYGSASFLGVPWKLILEAFSLTLGERRFDTLDEYQHGLLDFCASSHPLFTAELEATDFKTTVSSYWRQLFKPVFIDHGEDAREWDDAAWDAVRAAIIEDEEGWDCGLMEGFDEAFGREVLESFAEHVDELREYWFDGEPVPDDVWAGLLALIERMYTRNVIGSNLASGLVLLGYGEREYYPRFSQVTIGSRVLGRLRWYQGDHGAVDVTERTAVIQVFAEPDMVDAFILGVPRRVRRPLHSRIEAVAGEVLELAGVAAETRDGIDVGDVAGRAVQDFYDALHEQFRAPLMEAVAGLPTRELANLSRMLVSLTAFRSQLSVAETGSVGGEVKVAVLTKHGGVKWA